MPTDPRNPSHRARRRDESARREVGGDDFWGDARSWNQPTTQVPLTADRADDHVGHDAPSGGRLGRWWNSVTGAGASATRTHGSRSIAGEPSDPTPTDPTPAVGIDPYLDPAVEPSSVRGYRSHHTAEVAASGSAGEAERASSMSFATDHDAHDEWDVDGWHDDARWDDGWDVEPAAAPRVGIDPLIGRIGAIALIVTIAVPVVMGFTSQSDASEQLREVAAEATAIGSSDAEPAEVAATSTLLDSTTAAPQDRQQPASVEASPSSTAVASTSSSSDEVTTSSENRQQSAALTASPEPATTATTATVQATQSATTEPACGREYEVAAGDYWIRLADASGVRLADLLQVNGATVDTALVPGRTICLPAGASTPAPPPTNTQPSTTSRPSTTNPPATQAPTTQPPTTQPPTTQPPTTQAPTTTQAPPPTSSGDVESIIRSVWPDDLEDHALAIAWRESNYVPTAKNYCCYGLFQIYWEVHDVWLSQHGITSANQLFDPATNTRAAYLLYQRAGGFGPWGG